jgi:hypothetical protein
VNPLKSNKFPPSFYQIDIKLIKDDPTLETQGKVISISNIKNTQLYLNFLIDNYKRPETK